MSKIIKASLDEIGRVVEYLKDNIASDAIVFLDGDLASGKTTLTQAVAKSRGFESDVTSPTFSIQHNYGDGLYHYDLYRLSFEEFMSLGIFEEFDKSGWHLVEWGSEELKNFLIMAGYEVFKVSISLDENRRVYEVSKCSN